jgi:hypothetical protein
VAGWIAQKKYDGEYAEVELDSTGNICELRSKTGKLITTDEAKSLIGVFAGYPNSTLVGELTGHTEAGKADARKRGYSRIHIFDALKLDDQLIDQEPFSKRDELIKQMDARLGEIVGRDHPWVDDDRARARDFYGKFTKRLPLSWKRVPRVENFHGVERGAKLWEEYVKGEGGEGIVWCDPDAYVGKRASKLKEKLVDTLDVTVTAVGTRYCMAEFYDLRNLQPGASIYEYETLDFPLLMGRFHVQVGDRLEVGCFRFTEKTGLPKSPRILSKRTDLLQ